QPAPELLMPNHLNERLTGIMRRSDMKLTRIARKTARATMTAGQWLTVVVLSIPVVSCNLLDKGLEATAPDKIETSVLETPANAAAYAGYSRILLGEGFCEAAINLGPLLTSNDVFASAETMFTTAITAAQAAGDQQILNMAYVGRARARLDQGNKAGAATDAA